MELYLEAGVEGCEFWGDMLHDVVPQLEQEGGGEGGGGGVAGEREGERGHAFFNK